MGINLNECQCENGNCAHGDTSCTNHGKTAVQTIYGKYWMCLGCAGNMPKEYLSNTTLAPQAQ